MVHGPTFLLLHCQRRHALASACTMPNFMRPRNQTLENGTYPAYIAVND
jgi:hypothetical protein